MKFKKTDKCDRVKEAYLVITSNMQETILKEKTLKIINISREKLGCKGENEYGECVPDFIVFDPNIGGEKYEDEGRSYHLSAPWLEKKVYVKLDDYGTKENLSENIGFPVNTQFVATLMLPEDY
jgi:hypothetical protein